MGYASTPRSRNDLRLAAIKLRRNFGFEDDEPVDPVRILELLGIFNSDFEIVSVEEMGDRHGDTQLMKRVVRIREDVYEGAVQGRGRDRFTICHEIAHLFLHSSLCENVSLARMDERSIPIYKNPEWQADAFAAEFMMPYGELKSGMTVDEVMRTYGVSRAAAECQLRHCWK